MGNVRIKMNDETEEGIGKLIGKCGIGNYRLPPVKTGVQRKSVHEQLTQPELRRVDDDVAPLPRQLR